MSPAVRVPELAVTVGGDFRDNPKWDLDCEGGPGGHNVVLTVNCATGGLAQFLWRCKRNHHGCRVWRWGRQQRALDKAVEVRTLFVKVVLDNEWSRMDHRREYLERSTGAAVGYAWVRHANGTRVVVADVDLTPKKTQHRMRAVPSDEAIRVLGWHHVRASAVLRQTSKAWAVAEGEWVKLASGRGDRIRRARKQAGLAGERLDLSVIDVDEARWRIERELLRDGSSESAERVGG